MKQIDEQTRPSRTPWVTSGHTVYVIDDGICLPGSLQWTVDRSDEPGVERRYVCCDEWFVIWGRHGNGSSVNTGGNCDERQHSSANADECK